MDLWFPLDIVFYAFFPLGQPFEVAKEDSGEIDFSLVLVFFSPHFETFSLFPLSPSLYRV